MPKKIALLAVGGTIASVSDDPFSATNYVTRLKAADLLRSLPEKRPAAFPEVTGEDILCIDSASLTPDLWLTLAKRVTEVLENGADGVVITHGTDTLEESAYFLNLCIPSGKPVILTGAMRPASALGADGPANLCSAIVAAASEKLQGQGVLVCMNNVLIAARDVRKIHPNRADAFTPVEMGAVGSVTDGWVELNYSPVKLHTLNSRFDCRKISRLPEVRILFAYAGAPDDEFDFCLARKVPGIIIDGVGNGNLSTAWQKKVIECRGKTVIVRCTRANGFVNPGGAQDDEALGTISGGTLSAQKARILLMFALEAGLSLSEMRQLFARY